MDRLLDRGQSGTLYLRIPGIANVIVDAFFHGGEKLRLVRVARLRGHGKPRSPFNHALS